jgi:hypothetical protein
MGCTALSLAIAGWGGRSRRHSACSSHCCLDAPSAAHTWAARRTPLASACWRDSTRYPLVMGWRVGCEQIILECQWTLESLMCIQPVYAKRLCHAGVGSAEAQPVQQKKRRRALQDLSAAQSAAGRETPSPHGNRARPRVGAHSPSQSGRHRRCQGTMS